MNIYNDVVANTSVRTSKITTLSGNLLIQQYGYPTFGRIQLGGTSSSYPAILRNGTTIAIRLADNSDFANLEVGNLVVHGTTTGIEGGGGGSQNIAEVLDEGNNANGAEIEHLGGVRFGMGNSIVLNEEGLFSDGDNIAIDAQDDNKQLLIAANGDVVLQDLNTFKASGLVELAGNGALSYGYIQLQLVNAQSETGISLKNTSTDGRDYRVFSTGTGSGIGVGNFIVADATANAVRFKIDNTGDAHFSGVINGDGSGITSIVPANIDGYPDDETKVLKGDGTWAVVSAGAGASLEIGAEVGNSPTIYGLLYVDGDGLLAQVNTLYHSSGTLYATTFSGSGDDLTGFATVARSGGYNDLTDLPSLATVASSGSYNDLVDVPELSDESKLPLTGGTMTGGISWENYSKVDIGVNDQSNGGAKGISLFCSVSYELNWQAGHLTCYNGSTIYPIRLDSTLMVQEGVTINDFNDTSAIDPNGRALKNNNDTVALAWNETGVTIAGALSGFRAKIVENGGDELTLTDADSGTAILFTGSNPVTVICTSGCAIGTSVTIIMGGSLSSLLITGTDGASVVNRQNAFYGTGPWAVMNVTLVATNTWLVSGDLTD